MAKANEGIPAMGDIKCAMINVYKEKYNHDTDTVYVEIDVEAKLKVGFTKADYDNFIKKLDVEYDDGYGGQELFGTIWLKDGTWMDRGEYDGSEWWNYQVCPKVPKELFKKGYSITY